MEVLYLVFAFSLFVFFIYKYTMLYIQNKNLKEKIAKLEMDILRLKDKF